MRSRERSVVLCILFTIVTCGIYGLYWIAVLNDDMLDALNEDGLGGVLVLVISIVTCGIYGLFWIYQMGQRVDRLNARYGRHTDNSGILYLIISILFLSIVAYGVIQNELNIFYRNQSSMYDQQ